MLVASVPQSMAGSSQTVPYERDKQRPPAGWELERKFLLAMPRVTEVLDRLQGCTLVEVHDLERPVTWNRTTYFDTSDFAFLRSSCNGGIARKLRVREYASAASESERPRLTGTCYLELKESGGGLRSKTRVKLEPWLVAALLSGGRMRPDLPSGLLTFGSIFQRERPFPRMTSWYRRVTRVSLDGSVRITVDSQLLFAEPIVIATGDDEVEPESPVAREPFSIVEVKSAGALPRWLDGVLDSLDEVDDFSKFRRGMAHLYPGVT